MARAFDDASNQYLSNGNGIVTSPPFAMVAWARSDDLSDSGTDHALLSAGPSGDAHYYALFIGKTLAVDPCLARTYDGSVVADAKSTTGLSGSTNTWAHWAGIWVSSSDRRAFFNGGGKGTNSDVSTPSSPNQFAVGVTADSTPAGYLSGIAAEAAVYDISVWPGATDSDKADSFETIALPILALGYSPLAIPLGLIAHWPLVGRTSPEIDLVGGYDLTLNAAPTTAAHPPVIHYPVPGFIYQQEALAYPLVQIQDGKGVMTTANTIGSTARAIAYSEER